MAKTDCIIRMEAGVRLIEIRHALDRHEFASFAITTLRNDDRKTFLSKQDARAASVARMTAGRSGSPECGIASPHPTLVSSAASRS